MNDYDERLRQLLAEQESQAPDLLDVLSRAHAREAVFRRRRRAGQVAGSAVLGAGLIAGGTTALRGIDHTQHLRVASPGEAAVLPQPDTIGADASQTATPVPPSASATGSASATATASAAATVSPSATRTGDPSDDKALDAYFGAGYGYEEAQKFADLWHSTDVYQTKVDAGRKLLAGETLPLPPADPDQAAVQAFFGAGYTYDSAVTLAGLWHSKDVYQTKVDAGKKLLAGETLPITTPSPDPQEAALSAYFDAGYTYADAEQLAQLWHTTDPYQAKIMAGEKLQAGQALPIQP